MSRFTFLKEACVEANQALPASGLVDLTFGNVSVLDPDLGVFAIKPSGVAYSELTPQDIPIIDLDGERVEGGLQPSSDTPTHRHLFQVFAARGIHAIVHTHSRRAVAFASAGLSIPCLNTTHADYFHGPVPITRAMTEEEITSQYEWQTGRVIAECFAHLDPTTIPAVLVHHHGPFAWGATPAKAVENAIALEIVADMAASALSLNASASPIARHLLDKHFLRKHGDTAYYGQGVRAERAERAEPVS